jgi:hypothetical protein
VLFGIRPNAVAIISKALEGVHDSVMCGYSPIPLQALIDCHLRRAKGRANCGAMNLDRSCVEAINNKAGGSSNSAGGVLPTYVCTLKVDRARGVPELRLRALHGRLYRLTRWAVIVAGLVFERAQEESSQHRQDNYFQTQAEGQATGAAQDEARRERRRRRI